MKFNTLVLSVLMFFTYINSDAQNMHPNLLLTKKTVEIIRQEKDKYPLFHNTYQKIKNYIDSVIAEPMDVPVPKDAGGGYTHEKHKQNYNEMYYAGILYQITQDEKYAVFIRDMLNKYAELYPKIGQHPQSKIETPGRLFWQTLNENVWLVHTIQAYDCIYDWLSPQDREKYENNIFNPMCEYFMEHEEEFNRIHNHGTWMVTAVGMTGLVTQNDKYVQYSLYGTHLDGKGGFIKQLDLLFSPDGYYTEGPYYARYALWPFFIYAEALENNKPELKIYQYRDSILKKTLNALLQQTNTNGAFFPINDALKEKTWQSEELVIASNLIYYRYDKDDNLLSLVNEHGRVILSYAGLVVAKAIAKRESLPEFKWKSIKFSDGADGKQGGLAILRWGNNKEELSTLVFKYASHGLSHGHYDRLHFLYYDKGSEIIQDYGAARFLNIDQKFGGRYLPENKSYAMQTIAHNTIVADEKSHFDGKRSRAEKFHPEEYLFDISDANFQYVSAKEKNAYKGIELHRTLALVKSHQHDYPIIVDVFRVNSDTEHQYDLPYYFMGHIIDINFDYEAYDNQRVPLGKSNGYEHLWVTAKGKGNGVSSLTFLSDNNRFYTLLTTCDNSTDIYLTQIGANDKNYNLRNEQGIMFRKKAKNHLIVSVIEPHGEFNPTLEYTKNSYATISDIKVLYNDGNYTVIEIINEDKSGINLFIANNDPSKNKVHNINTGNAQYSWKGPIHLKYIN
ncbi:alginate lyase family protein [Melioribacter sp. Ez-97]|nr:alginate lyase family protein [Melioribacter roseus]